MSSLPETTPEARSGLFRRGDLSAGRADDHESLIDISSAVDGVFRVGHNLRIEGEAKGEIQCQGTLTVVEGATVSARVMAANIIVAGRLDGEITCRERLQILPTGHVSGSVTTNLLVIQEGAFYEGQLNMRTGATGDQPVAAATPAGGGAPTAAPPARTRSNRGSETAN